MKFAILRQNGIKKGLVQRLNNKKCRLRVEI